MPSPENVVGMADVIASTFALNRINKEDAGTWRRQIIFHLGLGRTDVAARRKAVVLFADVPDCRGLAEAGNVFVLLVIPQGGSPRHAWKLSMCSLLRFSSSPSPIADKVDELAETLLVEARVRVVPGQNALERWVVVLGGQHGVVDDLARWWGAWRWP